MISVSALYIALTALLALYLAYRVTNFRRGQRVGVGDNNDRAFSVAIRTHANLVEYAPLTLLLLLAAELMGAQVLFLHLMGLLFLLSRVAHAWGFTQSNGGASPFRMFGILANWIVMLILIAYLLWASL